MNQIRTEYCVLIIDIFDWLIYLLLWGIWCAWNWTHKHTSYLKCDFMSPPQEVHKGYNSWPWGVWQAFKLLHGAAGTRMEEEGMDRWKIVKKRAFFCLCSCPLFWLLSFPSSAPPSKLIHYFHSAVAVMPFSSCLLLSFSGFIFHVPSWPKVKSFLGE